MKPEFKHISNFCGEEVFVTCSVVEAAGHGELQIFPSFRGMLDLSEHLSGIAADSGTDIRVLHGLLLPAVHLPASLRGVTPFLVVQSKTNDNMGFVIESCANTVENFAADLVGLLKNGASMGYEDADDIDDLYVLYGYELQVVLKVEEEELDDEIINRCLAIQGEVEEIAEEIGDNNQNAGVNDGEETG